MGNELIDQIIAMVKESVAHGNEAPYVALFASDEERQALSGISTTFGDVIMYTDSNRTAPGTIRLITEVQYLEMLETS